MTSPPSGASHTPWRRKLAWALRRSAKAKSASRKSALGAYLSEEGVKDESGGQVKVESLLRSPPIDWQI